MQRTFMSVDADVFFAFVALMVDEAVDVVPVIDCWVIWIGEASAVVLSLDIELVAW